MSQDGPIQPDDNIGQFGNQGQQGAEINIMKDDDGNIKSETNFKGGNMNINNLFFKSDALNMHAQGTVGLLDEQLNMKAELVPLGTFDKILGFVPIVGKGAADLTKIYLDLEGPLENPKIRTRLTKGVATGVEDATKAAGKDVKKGTGFVEKGLEKIFGK